MLCKYPKSAINKIIHKQKDQKKSNKKKQIQDAKKCHIIVPYIHGICEIFKSICGKHGVAVHFKEGQTLKSILVSLKDKDTMTTINSVIYWYRCDKINCDEEYVGETSRTFGERYQEYLMASSPIFNHQNITGHNATVENFIIIGREGNSMARAIKKAIQGSPG